MKASQNLEPQIAASLDLPESLSPFAAQLMQGIDALGSYPVQTVALCKKLGLNTKTSVLDLACGKGSIAVELAATFGCNVTGVDASSEFLRSAQKLARHRNVRLRCIMRDVRAFRSVKKFEVVIMLNLLPIEDAAEFCRPFVKPGGFLILDDATLAPGKKDPRWYSPKDAKMALEAEGDTVFAQRQVPAAAVSRLGLAIEHNVSKNGLELAKLNPKLRSGISAYLKRLKSSRLLLTSTLRPTIFAVKVTA